MQVLTSEQQLRLGYVATRIEHTAHARTHTDAQAGADVAHVRILDLSQHTQSHMHVHTMIRM